MNMHLGLLFIFIPFFFILEKSCLGWQAIFVIQIKKNKLRLFLMADQRKTLTDRSYGLRQNSAIVQ